MDYIERELEKTILSWIDAPECLAIRGPRQSGKTTLVKHFQKILASDYGESHIIYISLEDDLKRLSLEENPRSFIEGHCIDNKKHIFLIDEIQYLKNAGKILKLLYDVYGEKIKLIITGSSSLDIRQIGQYMVGRILFFDLYPFSFGEFLHSKDVRLYTHYKQNRFAFEKDWTQNNTVFADELKAYLDEYLRYGGYPRIVMEKNLKHKEELLNNLFTTYVEKDVLKIYGAHYWRDALTILKYLAGISGNLLRIDTLCHDLKIKRHRLTEFLSIFEETFIIRLIRPFHNNMTTELRKTSKIYFIDQGLRNILFEKFHFSPSEKGHLLENYAFLQLMQNYNVQYWRTTAKAEVDFIIKKTDMTPVPVEVKITPKITRALRSFMNHYSPKLAVVASDSTECVKQNVNDIPVIYVPAVYL